MKSFVVSSVSFIITSHFDLNYLMFHLFFLQYARLMDQNYSRFLVSMVRDVCCYPCLSNSNWECL